MRAGRSSCYVVGFPSLGRGQYAGPLRPGDFVRAVEAGRTDGNGRSPDSIRLRTGINRLAKPRAGPSGLYSKERRAKAGRARGGLLGWRWALRTWRPCLQSCHER